MSWTAYHTRGEILGNVIETADRRRDGLLPMDVDGVAEKFDGELDLLCALQLKWHTRLAGRIERVMAEQPLGLEDAVVAAWQAVAEENPGVRAILDHYRARPTDAAMATAVAKSVAKEHVLLAVMAGYASVADELAAPVGARIEETARTAPRPAGALPRARTRLLCRLRAGIAA